MIQKKRSGRAQGRILEVIEKSPLETREPVCSNFPACGGCMYQTMSYEEPASYERDTDTRASGRGIDPGWSDR